MGSFLDFIPGIGSAIGAVANLISGNQANKTNLKIARDTNNAQMELAKYQADQNLNLWNLNNEYNSPSAQMERYKEAGLNPNLIYGNGSSSAGNSSSPAEGYNPPTLQRYNVNNQYVANSAQMLANGLLSVAQIQKTKAETSQIYQQISNLQSDKEYRDLQIIYQGYANSKSQVEAQNWLDLLNARKASLLGSAHNAESSALTNDVLRPMLVQQKQAEVDNLLMQNENLRYRLEKLNPAELQRLEAQIADLIADAQLKRLNQGLVTANIGYVTQNTEYAKENTHLSRERAKESFLNQEGKYLQNQINQILIENGINLKTSGQYGIIERLVYNLINNF